MPQTVICPACRSGAHNLAEVYDGYKIMRCADCGLNFCDPMQGGEESFYKQHFVYRKLSVETIKEHLEAASNKSNRRLLEMVGKTGRVLDIGCGPGAFVKYCVDNGYDAYGVDFNDERINAGRQVFGLGERLIAGDVRDLQNIEEFRNSFDLVTLFEVIEHVENPESLINNARTMLRDNGLLAISCPNEARWQPTGRIFADYPPHHLTRWRPETLRRFVERLGFEHIKTKLDSSFSNLLWVAYVNRSAKEKLARQEDSADNGRAKAKKAKKVIFSIVKICSAPFDLILKLTGTGTLGMRAIFKKV